MGKGGCDKSQHENGKSSATCSGPSAARICCQKYQLELPAEEAREATPISILSTRNINFTFLSRTPPPETSKHIIDVFSKDTALSLLYLSCAIPLPLAAINIVTKHKVCAQNLVSDARLLYKQYKFCEKQKELTDEFKAKVIYIAFHDVSKKFNFFKQKCQICARVTEKRHSYHSLPPPKKTTTTTPNIQLTFLVGKSDMRGFP